MIAYVLVSVPAKRSGELVQLLKPFPAIKECYAVYGETDVIARVEVPDVHALNDLVMGKIQGLDIVKSTRTLIAIEEPGLHWRR